MLQDGSWKTANFRKFNLDAEPKVGYSIRKPPNPLTNHRHPSDRYVSRLVAVPDC